MAATPSAPSQFVKTVTIGGSRSPGRLVILNGEVVITGGADSSTYNILIDGINEKIIVGADDEIVLDGPNKRIAVGGTNLIIDGDESRIVLNDGSDDRVLIGKLAGKF